MYSIVHFPQITTKIGVDCQILTSDPLSHRCVSSSTGPCFTTSTWHCRKNFSQWKRNFLWRLRYHWLKRLPQRQVSSSTYPYDLFKVAHSYLKHRSHRKLSVYIDNHEWKLVLVQTWRHEEFLVVKDRAGADRSKETVGGNILSLWSLVAVSSESEEIQQHTAWRDRKPLAYCGDCGASSDQRLVILILRVTSVAYLLRGWAWVACLVCHTKLS